MNLKFTFVLAGLLVNWFTLFGQVTQTPPKVVPPSPEAAALGKYGEIPVSYYTGIPAVNIPLYKITSGFPLPVELSLSYNTNGIKVEEEASMVGLGWTLNYGGTITRSVRNVDDFYSASGYLECEATPATVGSAPASYWDKVAVRSVDTEPDVFIYNILGKTGKFVIKKQATSSNVIETISLTKNDITITGYRISHPDNTINYPNKVAVKWEIMDEQGYKYYLQTQEYTTSVSSSTDTPLSETNILAPFNTSNTEYFASYTFGDINVATAWYLDKIQAPNGQEIKYQYKKDYDVMSICYGNETGYKIFAMTGSSRCLGWANVSKYDKESYGFSQSGTYTVFPQTITFEGGHIEFVTSNRRDMLKMGYQGRLFAGNTPKTNGPQKLEEILIYQEGKTSPLEKIKFATSYFNDVSPYNGSPVAEALYLRLRLDEVQSKLQGDSQKDRQGVQKYKFDYHQIYALPSKQTRSRDHWGYNNGETNTKLMPPIYIPDGEYQWYTLGNAIRTPKKDFAQVGTLKTISYPTGGSSTFTYDLNSYRLTEKEYYKDLSVARVNGYGVSGINSDTPLERPITITKRTQVNFTAGLYCGVPWLPSGDCKLGSGDYSIPYAAIVYRDSPTRHVDNFPTGFLGEWDNRSADATNIQFSSYYPVATGKQYRRAIVLEPGNYLIKTCRYNNFLGTFDIDIPNEADGGELHFEPSLNKYVDVPAGGLRIAAIIDKDGDKIIKEKNYSYTTSINGQQVSSGQLMVPVNYQLGYDAVGSLLNPFPTTGTDSDETCTYTLGIMYYNAQSNIPIASSAGGYPIGYDQVTETVKGPTSIGKTVYSYYNATETVISRVPGTPTLTNAGTNGKSKAIEYLNSKGIPVKTSLHDVKKMDFPTIPAIKIILDTYTQIFGSQLSWQMPFVREAAYYTIKPEFVYESKVEERNYNEDGITYLTAEKQFFYDKVPTHYQLTRTVTRNSSNEIMTDNFIYPLDYTTTISVAGIKNLREKHIYSSVIEKYSTLQKANGTFVTGGQLTTFYEDKPFTKEVKKLEFINPIVLNQFAPSSSTGDFVPDARYQSTIFYDYDGKGNLKEFVKTADVPRTYLWGYGARYPIAEIQNADWNTVAAKLAQVGLTSTSLEALNDAATIRTKMDALRTLLPQALLTCYTYEPLLGATSSTDPTGVTTYYEYDSFNRLSLIKDNKGNILKAYKYNYRLQ